MSDHLARLLVVVALDLERLGYAKAGVVRRAARALVEQAGHAEGCARCGGEVVQPATGRRRKYCTSCSPRKT